MQIIPRRPDPPGTMKIREVFARRPRMGNPAVVTTARQSRRPLRRRSR